MLGQVHPQVASQFDIDRPGLPLRDRRREAGAGRRGRARFTAAIALPGGHPGHRAAGRRASGRQGRVASSRERARSASDLFDVYEGPPLPEGKRSLAFAVQFQSPDKTLTDAEVADARRRIVRRLEHEVGAELAGPDKTEFSLS